MTPDPHPAIDLKTLLALNIHEIKNLMALLMLRLQAVQMAHGEVSDCQLLCHRVNDCMEQMLLLFSLQTEKLVPSLQANSPSDFISEFVNNALVLADGKLAITMEVEFAPDYWFFDRDLIGMAMLNAIHNALRYAKNRIIIRAALEDNALTLSVEDDGVGFPQAILDDPLRSVKSQHYKDLGLGLFFADIIACAHVNKNRQGALLLHNKSGDTGGVFTLQLP